MLPRKPFMLLALSSPTPNTLQNGSSILSALSSWILGPLTLTFHMSTFIHNQRLTTSYQLLHPTTFLSLRITAVAPNLSCRRQSNCIRIQVSCCYYSSVQNPPIVSCPTQSDRQTLKWPARLGMIWSQFTFLMSSSVILPIFHFIPDWWQACDVFPLPLILFPW